MQIKKLFTSLTFITFCLMLSFTFSGCRLFTPREPERRVELTFIWLEDGSIVHEETIIYGKNADVIDLEVPGRAYGDYEIVVKEFRDNDQIVYKRIVCTPKIGSKKEIDFANVTKGGGITFALVKFVEYRNFPTLVLDPNFAIDYVENERYVYKYNALSDCTYIPIPLYCKYEDKIIYIAKYTVIGKREGGTGPISSLEKIGTYEITIYVYPENYFNEQDRIYYAGAQVTLTIEIIE